MTLIGVTVALASRLSVHLDPPGPRPSAVMLGFVFSAVLFGGLSAVFARTGGNVYTCAAAAFIWLVVIGAPAPGRLAVLVGGAVSAVVLAAGVAASAKAAPGRPATRA